MEADFESPVSLVYDLPCSAPTSPLPSTMSWPQLQFAEWHPFGSKYPSQHGLLSHEHGRPWDEDTAPHTSQPRHSVSHPNRLVDDSHPLDAEYRRIPAGSHLRERAADTFSLGLQVIRPSGPGPEERNTMPNARQRLNVVEAFSPAVAPLGAPLAPLTGIGINSSNSGGQLDWIDRDDRLASEDETRVSVPDPAGYGAPGQTRSHRNHTI